MVGKQVFSKSIHSKHTQKCHPYEHSEHSIAKLLILSISAVESNTRNYHLGGEVPS